MQITPPQPEEEKIDVFKSLFNNPFQKLIMDFFTEMFSELTTSESFWVILWLCIAGLIGFLTAYFYWKGSNEALQKQFDQVEQEAADLRIRNTELLMMQEEVRKEIKEAKDGVAAIETTNKQLSREKGQLYADLTMARKELEALKSSTSSTVSEAPKEGAPVEDIPEISLDNVMKASASLTGMTAPPVEDAKSALDQKKKSGDQQKDAAAFIQGALGSRIKTVEADQKDNLQMIKGVGPFIEGKLNKLGIFTFEQISQLDEELIDQLTEAIQFFPGRILRDDWVGQAKDLME